ncbi:replication initiator protein A [Streptococcus anginosus]|nr:replication initiator protein A [Streptococcus anginosus]
MVYTVNDIKENIRFIAMPIELFENDCFSKLSNDAKVLYGFMRNRLSLSIKNNWIDGTVPYIHFSIDETEAILKKSRATAVKIKKELLDVGLIEIRKVFNGSDVIFVNRVTDVAENELAKVQKLNSESLENELAKVQKLNSNYTNYNYTNNNYKDKTSAFAVGGLNTLFSKANRDNIATPTTTSKLGEFNNLIVENFGKQPSPLQIDEMRYLVKEHDLEVLKLAVKECVDNGKPYFAYMNTILNNWKHDGLNTPELVKNRVKPRSRAGIVTMLDDGYDEKLGI